MPRRYNLRKRDPSVKWIEDETLKEKDEETESEDEDYEAPSEEEEEEEEEEELDEETDEETDDEDEEEEPQSVQHINVPIPKNSRVKIEIDTRPGRSTSDSYEEEEEFEDDDEEEEAGESGGFLGYLMNKYVPRSRIRMGKEKKEKEDNDTPPIELNDEEQDYYDELPKSKRKKLTKKMKQIESLLAEGDVPRKFRILDLPVSDPLKASVIKKLDTLAQMEEEGGDTHKLRTWIDGFMRIPFGLNVPLPVKMDDGSEPCAKFLAETRLSLDNAVYGMQPAKTQIMQILAQWIANPGSVGNVIALKGPMGVGKTSFARNGVANVLKRPFEFFSLGGATDSANFVGHSYTYEGSMWGRIVDSLISARCMNPVMYFDELDKVSETPHGQEIVSMLIHLTDRSQNSQFHDRYFAGVDIDLSQCLFVFSFNDESRVHPILKDRMQVITCTGYSADDKFQIVEKYIWPQMLERTNFKDLTIKSDAIKFLIREYSSDEEGVRTLIRALEALTTRINLLRIADEETAKSYKFYTKVKLPCCIDTEMARHILQDMTKTVNESWQHLYT
jgi:ATP-dependent Lon protease